MIIIIQNKALYILNTNIFIITTFSANLYNKILSLNYIYLKFKKTNIKVYNNLKTNKTIIS